MHSMFPWQWVLVCFVIHIAIIETFQSVVQLSQGHASRLINSHFQALFDGIRHNSLKEDMHYIP